MLKTSPFLLRRVYVTTKCTLSRLTSTASFAKGNRDRLVPLPAHTLEVLREFWKVHRHPVLLFPNRQKGLKGASSATTHMDRGGVQQALRQVTEQISLKKELRRIA